MKKTNAFNAFAFAASVLGVAGLANASGIVNIDFTGNPNRAANDVFSGQGAYSTSDQHLWNGLNLSSTDGTGQSTSISNLKSSDGSSTNVGFTLGPTNQFGTANGDGSPTSTGNSLLDNTADIYLWSGWAPGSSTFNITGLNANHKYEFYLYSTYGTYAYGTGFTLTGATTTNQQEGFTEDPANGLLPADGSYVLNRNYLDFSNITPDANGNISGTWYNPYNPYRGVTQEFAVFNGLQIVDLSAVPEPTSIGLLALGAPMLLQRRRRRQA